MKLPGGILVRVGTFLSGPTVDHLETVTGFVIEVDRAAIEQTAHIPIYRPVEVSCAGAPEGMTRVELVLPAALNPMTRQLVAAFAEALADKLFKAEQKYGYSDGWTTKRWIEDGTCARKLREHAAKGDPRDVAAYCAFLWWHKASTSSGVSQASPGPGGAS